MMTALLPSLTLYSVSEAQKPLSEKSAYGARCQSLYLIFLLSIFDTVSNTVFTLK